MSWKSKFSWLRFNATTGKMFCLSCEKLSKDSAFSYVCSNFQQAALVRHLKSDEHVISCQTQKQQRFMDTAIAVVKKQQHESLLEAQWRTVLYMASEKQNTLKIGSSSA